MNMSFMSLHVEGQLSLHHDCSHNSVFNTRLGVHDELSSEYIYT